jgi:hypothetical protein
MSPFEALYGFIPEPPVALLNPSVETAQIHRDLQDVHALVRQNMELAKEFQIQYATKGNIPQYKVGDMVKVDATHINLRDQPTEKLKDRWVGPFKVVKVVSPLAYKLALPPQMECYPVFHVSKLSPWRKDAEHPDHVQPDKPLRARGDLITGGFLAEKILRVKAGKHFSTPNGKVLLFRVKWVGYPSSQNTWEPYSGVRKLDVFKEFLQTTRWKEFKSTKAYKEMPPSRVPTL